MTSRSPRSLRYATEADMPEGMRRLMRTKADQAPAAIPPKRAKFGNIATVVDGIRFASKREARYYEQLKVRKAAGDVAYWHRQVPIHLPGGTRYVVDFLLFFVDGRPPEYVDVKGRETQVFKIKRREVEHHYPIRLVLA